MLLLLIVSVVWAFSFGLVKSLSGIDPSIVAVLRLAISLVVFAPFLRPAGLSRRSILRLLLIGTVQFGAMYVLYQRSYLYLHAYEVALFTITTPILVAAADAVAERRWHARYAAAALLSVAGAGALVWKSAASSATISGFLLVQLANLCFASGQVAWRRERARLPREVSDASVFALPYAGAVLFAFAVSLFTSSWGSLAATPTQWAILAYLGAVASGLCFFLWNVGATRVNAGVLSAFNNAKIPLGVAASLLVFGEHADLRRLVLGGGLMVLGVWVARRRPAAGPAALS